MKNTRIIFLVLILAVNVVATVYYLNKEKIAGEYQGSKISDIYSTLRDATTTPEEIASWAEFINNRVGWQFRYPTENLTRPIDEIVKFPSAVKGQSMTEDLLEFAVGETVFSIKTYVNEATSTIESWGEATSTIESWIKKPNMPISFDHLSEYKKITIAGITPYSKINVNKATSTIKSHESQIEEPDKPRISGNLSDYEKFTIAGNAAYNLRGKAFAYTLVNDNIYEIAAYQDEVLVKLNSEPLFKKWISTIQFFEQIECWKIDIPV